MEGSRNTDAPQSPKAETAKGQVAANDATRTEEIAKAKKNVSPEAPIEEAAASAEEKGGPTKDDEGAAPATEGEASAPAEDWGKEEEDDNAPLPTGTEDFKEEELKGPLENVVAEGGGTEEDSAPPAKGEVDDDDPARRGAGEGANPARTRGGDNDAAPPAEGAARAAEEESSVDALPGDSDIPLIDETPMEDGSSAAKDETESCRAVSCDDDADDKYSWDNNVFDSDSHMAFMVPIQIL